MNFDFDRRQGLLKKPRLSLLFLLGILIVSAASRSGFGVQLDVTSGPKSSGRLFIGQQGVRTAVAVLNSTNGAVDSQWILRDADGREKGRQSWKVNAGQSVVYLDELFSGIDEGFLGDVTFQSERPLTVLALRQTSNPNSEPRIAALPIADLSTSNSDAATSSFVHVAMGNGLSSRLVLMNPGNHLLKGLVQFTARDGSPLQLQLNGEITSQFSYQLNPDGVSVTELQSTDNAGIAYATITPQDGVSPIAQVIIQSRIENGTISEAVTQAALPVRSARFPAGELSSARTLLALANANAEAADVTIHVTDRSGTLLQTKTFSVAARADLSVSINELLSGLPEGFTGFLDVDSSLSLTPTIFKMTIDTLEIPRSIDRSQPNGDTAPQLHFDLTRQGTLSIVQMGSISSPTSGISSTRTLFQASGTCDPTVSNPIVCENQKTGNPASEWDITGSGDATVQGYATDISVNKGQTVSFKIKTDATSYRIDIYRLGYYNGMGARKVATINPSATLPQTQPSCLVDRNVRLVDCGNWSVSASWAVPSDAVSGVYIAKPVLQGGAVGTSHMVFIVRDDTGHSDILFQTSDTTWQAYNPYGGFNLYSWASPEGRAYKVSYNRPFNTRSDSGGMWGWVFSAEYPMIRFLEANGYNVSYFTGVDSDRMGAAIKDHKIFLSVGHDEYWSAGQRANVEAARNAGVNLAFFSGNESFWKTRWETSMDGSGTPYRTLVTYKETHNNAKIDPTPAWTGTWRDPRFSPPADGGRPENALTGTLFRVNGIRHGDAIVVPAAYSKMRIWRNTSIASLAPGKSAVFPNDTLGFEWDESPDNGFAPPGRVLMSSTTVNINDEYLLDYGTYYGKGTATHNLTMYKHSSGAIVFGAGTVQWSWGLDATHDNGNGSSAADVRMQQATINLFADMKVQPGTIRSGLTKATASTDTTAPISKITSPANGATLRGAGTVLITGTAVDSGGGVVAGVEVSVDGGQTWHMANGKENWSYPFFPANVGPITIKSRSVDDSGNLENPTSINVTAACPCTLWTPDATPAEVVHADPTPIEVGVQFRTDVGGSITGIRFYKGPANNGAHTVSLYTAGGTLLARALSNPSKETDTGWQQADFDTPVNIPGNTVFVATYHTTSGNYAYSANYFNSDYDHAPLHALAAAKVGGNGRFGYTSTPNFPADTYNGGNYWVDPVFINGPAIGNVQATSVTASGATISWTTDIASNSQVDLGLTPAYNLASPLNSTMVTSHTATLTGLMPCMPYHFRVKSQDANSILSVSTDFLFTTISTGGANFPCSLWPSSTLPAEVSHYDTNGSVELGLNFYSDLDGVINGVRFYKGPENTGIHIVSLWTTGGTLLAQSVAGYEDQSGWQQVNFPAPVNIQANTVYVASYHTASGSFSLTPGYFFTPYSNGPLHALGSSSGQNGVFVYSSTSVFPYMSYQAGNYWADISFNPIGPSVNLSGNATTLAYNTTASLSWTSLNATSCSAAGGPWSGSKALNGSETTVALTADTTFTLRCTGPGGTQSSSVTVKVAAPPAPVVTLSTNATMSAFNTTSTLSWTTSNVTSCTATSGPWSGTKALNGSEATPALTSDTTFTLTCTGPGGTTTSSVTIKMNALQSSSLTCAADITLKNTNDQLKLDCDFSLASNSDGIAADVEAFGLVVGGYKLVLPAGTFDSNNGKPPYKVNRTIAGDKINIAITKYSDGSYRMTFDGQNMELPALTNPLGITLSIGNDLWSTSSTAKFH